MAKEGLLPGLREIVIAHCFPTMRSGDKTLVSTAPNRATRARTRSCSRAAASTRGCTHCSSATARPQPLRAQRTRQSRRRLRALGSSRRAARQTDDRDEKQAGSTSRGTSWIDRERNGPAQRNLALHRPAGSINRLTATGSWFPVLFAWAQRRSENERVCHPTRFDSRAARYNVRALAPSRRCFALGVSSMHRRTL